MCTISVYNIFLQILKILFLYQIYHNPGTPKSNYMGKLKEDKALLTKVTINCLIIS